MGVPSSVQNLVCHLLESSEVGFEIAVDCYNTRAEVSLHGNGVSLQEFPMCYGL